jgi:hypothetical protein
MFVYCSFVVFGHMVLGGGIGALVPSLFHIPKNFDDVLTTGLWTIPNALVVDLFVVNMLIALLTVPLAGSLVYRKLRVRKSRNEPIPSILPNWRKSIPYSLSHYPCLVFDQNTKKTKFSFSRFGVMASKSVFISLVSFAFVVMPTCSILTVLWDLNIQRLGRAPTNCDDIVNFHALVNGAALTSDVAADPNPPKDGKIFESLCWQFVTFFAFEIVWGAIVACCFASLGVVTALIQFGPTQSTISADKTD